MVANAILPPVETASATCARSTAPRCSRSAEIADEFADIQSKLDEADSGLNPLGLVGDAVLFDLDPQDHAGRRARPTSSRSTSGPSASLDNTVDFFDYANQMKVAQRESQNSQRDFVSSIVDQDRARMNELIELFGYPYDADIGVNGTYPAGYDGPDIFNYDLIDRTELTDPEALQRAEIARQARARQTKTYTVAVQGVDCLGNYVTAHALYEMTRDR